MHIFTKDTKLFSHLATLNLISSKKKCLLSSNLDLIIVSTLLVKIHAVLVKLVNKFVNDALAFCPPSNSTGNKLKRLTEKPTIFSSTTTVLFCTVCTFRTPVIFRTRDRGLFSVHALFATRAAFTDAIDEVFFKAYSNSSECDGSSRRRDAQQQLTQQLHAYCCTSHENRWFTWTMCLSRRWALTSPVCQWHRRHVRSGKAANLSNNVCGFWWLSIISSGGIWA